MPKPRVIVKRRKAVRNIHKITRTMQLIATSKFQRAHNRAVASRPYTDKVSALVSQLARVTGGRVSHPLLERREAKVDLLLVITSNRGLCGGYNSAVLRAGVAHCQAEQAAGRSVRVDVVGKKGLIYLKYRGQPIEAGYTDIGDKPTFAQVEKLAERYIGLFAGERAIESVHVAYMRFVSAGVQRPTVATLLPLSDLEGEKTGVTEVTRPGHFSDPGRSGEASPKRVHTLEDYDFSPSPEELLAELLPITVKVRLFQFLNDAVVSEQVARMTAMKAATDNAADMIKLLTQQYNRARQAQITKELSEIIGGAEALD